MSPGHPHGKGHMQSQNLRERCKLWDTSIQLLFEVLIKVMGKFTSCSVLPHLVQGSPTTLMPEMVGCPGNEEQLFLGPA